MGKMESAVRDMGKGLRRSWAKRHSPRDHKRMVSMSAIRRAVAAEKRKKDGSA